MTDMRPVFGSDEKPAGAVVVHTLKLTYHEGPKRSLREFFVAMNRDDLDELREVLDRALRKQSELSHVLAQCGLPDLDKE